MSDKSDKPDAIDPKTLELLDQLEDTAKLMDPHGPGAVSLLLPTFGLHINVCQGVVILKINRKLAVMMHTALATQLSKPPAPADDLAGDASWADGLDTTKGN